MTKYYITMARGTGRTCDIIEADTFHGAFRKLQAKVSAEATTDYYQVMYRLSFYNLRTHRLEFSIVGVVTPTGISKHYENYAVRNNATHQALTPPVTHKLAVRLLARYTHQAKAEGKWIEGLYTIHNIKTK